MYSVDIKYQSQTVLVITTLKDKSGNILYIFVVVNTSHERTETYNEIILWHLLYVYLKPDIAYYTVP